MRYYKFIPNLWSIVILCELLCHVYYVYFQNEIFKIDCLEYMYCLEYMGVTLC